MTFPRVQPDMMMITTGGEERGLASVTLREFKSEHIAIKRNCALKVGNLQMNMSDADVRVNWLWLLLLHGELSLNGFVVKTQSNRSQSPRNRCNGERQL